MCKIKKWSKTVLCMILLVALTASLWAVASSGGSVKIRRINIAANDGTIASAIMYIPETATDETPAPVVLNFAGRSTNAQYLTTWSMEQARRGFVVISCDVWGNGQTEMYGQADATGGMSTNNSQAMAFIEYALTCPFVDSKQMNFVGYSLGSIMIKEMCAGHEDVLNSVILVFQPMGLWMYPDYYDVNMMVITSEGEETIHDIPAYEKTVTEVFGLDKPVEEGVLYGSFADRTAREYILVENSIHQTATMAGETCSGICDFLMKANTGINYIDPSDLKYPLEQTINTVCGILFFITVCCAAWELMQVPFFSGIVSTVPGQKKKYQKGHWIFQFAWAILVPMILFMPIGDLVMFHKPMMNNPVFRSNYLNGGFFPLFFFSLISLIIILVQAGKKKKAGEMVTLADYGLARQGENKLPWDVIGKSVVLGFFVTLLALAWMFAVEGNTGLNYQVWQVIIYNRTSQERFKMAFAYMPFFLVALGVPAITMNTARRLPDTGNANKDLVRDIALNFIVAFLPVFLILFIQYGPSFWNHNGITTWNRATYHLLWAGADAASRSSTAAIDYAWNIPWVQGSSAALNTYLYRKTGTVWPGVIIGAIFTAVVVCSNYTLAC